MKPSETGFCIYGNANRLCLNQAHPMVLCVHQRVLIHDVMLSYSGVMVSNKNFRIPADRLTS